MLSPYAVGGDAGETRCGLCRRMEPPFARAVAYGSYDGGLRELIHLLKYEQVRPAATVLGRMLAEAVSGARFLLDPGAGDGGSGAACTHASCASGASTSPS